MIVIALSAVSGRRESAFVQMLECAMEIKLWPRH